MTKSNLSFCHSRNTAKVKSLLSQKDAENQDVHLFPQDLITKINLSLYYLAV